MYHTYCMRLFYAAGKETALLLDFLLLTKSHDECDVVTKRGWIDNMVS